MSDEQADNKPQVTAPTATAPRLKNPKRVEAGKLNAEKTRKAREAQKKALAEAEAKIANYEAKEKRRTRARCRHDGQCSPASAAAERVCLLGLQHDPMVDGCRHSGQSSRDLCQT